MQATVPLAAAFAGKMQGRPANLPTMLWLLVHICVSHQQASRDDVTSTTASCHAARRAALAASVPVTPLWLPADDLKQRLPTAMAPGGQDLTSGVAAVSFVASVFWPLPKAAELLLTGITTCCVAASPSLPGSAVAFLPSNG